MKRYYITDRSTIGGLEPLLGMIRRALESGIEMIQVREKDLEARELFEFAQAVKALPNPHQTRLLLNSRVDIAIAARFDGVHLPSRSIPACEIRRIVPAHFLIGVSAHASSEIDPDADFAVFGPVFASPSKPGYGPAVGIEGLRAACTRRPIAIYALGGITAANAESCIVAGAAGIAGISLFQESLGVDLLQAPDPNRVPLA